MGHRDEVSPGGGAAPVVPTVATGWKRRTGITGAPSDVPRDEEQIYREAWRLAIADFLFAAWLA